MKPQKIFVCSAGFGEGHNTAANNLCAAFASVAPPGTFEAEFLDALSNRHPRTNELFRRGYLTLMNRAPKVWAAIYRLLDSTSAVEGSLSLLASVRDHLAELLERERPAAIVSAYPLYGYLLDAIAARGGPSDFLKVMVVTDSISINSIWHRCSADFFCVPNEQTADVMRKAGVAPEKLRVLGFPSNRGLPPWARLARGRTPPDPRAGASCT